MGGNHHRRLGIVVADDGGEDVVPGGGIHAADGLIQQIQLCRPAHGHDELHLLPGALAHLLDLLFGLDIQVLEHLLRRVPAKIGIEILIEVQKLVGSHPGGDRGPLRQVADQRMALLPRCYTTNKNLPTGRSQQAVSQLDESGLAASVGSQQSHDAARLDGKVHAVQRRHMPIIFCQCFTFQNRHPRFPPHLSPAAAGT